MVKVETLVRRTNELEAAIAADKQSPPCNAPGWMAKTPDTRLLQRDRYRRAGEQMRQSFSFTRANEKRTFAPEKPRLAAFINVGTTEA
jgi:hypothetical protein